MKKLQQLNGILVIVALAMFYKAYTDNNKTLILIGIFLIALAIFRMLLVKQASKANVYEKAGKDNIIRFLEKDPILYIHMYTVYKKGYCDILYEENDGLLLYDRMSDTYLGTATNKAGAMDIVAKLPIDYGTFIGHDAIFDELDEHAFPIGRKLFGYNHVYTKKIQIEIKAHPYQLSYLDESYLSIIKQHYQIDYLCTDEYLRSCIKEGMLGIFEQDVLMGFIGIHKSGAMGMLEVFEPYRGKQLATTLQSAYTNELVKKGYSYPIYTQVNAENNVSLHIQSKLSFKKANTPCIWYFSK